MGPDLFGVQGRQGSRKGQQEEQKGPERHPGDHRGHPRQFDGGDQHRQEEHVDHPPGDQPAQPAEHLTRERWPPVDLQGKEHIEDQQGDHSGGEDSGESHQGGEEAVIGVVQAQDRRGQAGGDGLTLDPHLEEGMGHCHQVEHQGGEGQRQGAVEGILVMPHQEGPTADAANTAPRGRPGHPLQETAVVADLQLRLGVAAGPGGAILHRRSQAQSGVSSAGLLVCRCTGEVRRRAPMLSISTPTEKAMAK